MRTGLPEDKVRPVANTRDEGDVSLLTNQGFAVAGLSTTVDI